MCPIPFTSPGPSAVTLESLATTSNPFSFTLNMATEFFDEAYRSPSALDGKFFPIGLVGVLIDTDMIFLIELDDISLDDISPGNISLDNISPDDVSFDRESGINEVSDSDFSRDSDDDDGLYYRRTSIDDERDLENVSFGDDEQVDVASESYSWKIDHSKGEHKLKGIDTLNV